MCLDYKSDKGCKYGDKCRFRHVEVDVQTSKKLKKSGVTGSVAFFFGVYTIGFCVSCFSSEKIYSTERRKIGIESHRRTRGTTSQFGTEKVHREASFRKCEFHERNPCAPKFAERTRDETLHQERCACRVAWDLANHVCKLKKTDNAAFYYPFEARAMRAPTDSGASRHMLCKKELSWDEMETLRRSRNSTTVVTASGEVQTNVEAHEYVHDLDLFVTGSLLEETSAVLSTLRRTRRTTAVDQTREHIMQNGRLRTSCCPGLPSNSGTNSSSLSQDSSSTSSRPATERSDEPAPGNWRESPKTQNRNEKTKRDTNRASDDRLRDLPEWFHTHFSKDRNCEVCLRTKMTRAPCRRCTGEAAPLAEKFGDLMTADHKVLSENCESRNNHRYAVVVQAVKNSNFSEDGKEFEKASRAVGKTESHLHWQFTGIWQTLWRSIMESSNFNTSSIRDEWHCWKSRTQSERRNICCIVAIRLGWKMVGWFYGMLLLSATCPRPPGRCENYLRKAIRRNIEKSNNWWNIIRFLHETSPGSTILARKFYLE